MHWIAGSRVIVQQFTEGERERFHNLLKLAEGTPFPAERAAAIAAAERLAARCGMTMAEAAGAGPERSRTQADTTGLAAAWMNHIHLMDQQILQEKARRADALRAARARGLDAGEAPTPPTRSGLRSRRRMTPRRHAWALVHETGLSFREIARITGLDIYTVVAMKIERLRARRDA